LCNFFTLFIMFDLSCFWKLLMFSLVITDAGKRFQPLSYFDLSDFLSRWFNLNQI